MLLTDSHLDTPCLLLDRTRFERNAGHFLARFEGSGVTLRPHLKTVKCVEAARLLLPTPTGPATVSTLAEAEQFAAAGITDLLYAVGLAPQKIDRVQRLRSVGTDLRVIVDNDAAVDAIVAAVRAGGDPIPTLIEVDVDGHRCGVSPDDETALLRLAGTLDAVGCFEGILTHAGESYRARSAEDASHWASLERDRSRAVAELLRARDLPCRTVSVGSTPTALTLSDPLGITELRAGVYSFFDLFQAGVGVCSLDDIAISVLATVIGHQKDRRWILIDAGWMALSRDRSTASQATDQYYGVVCDLDGVPIPDLVVLETNQEHGIVTLRPGATGQLPELQVGARLRILPNHACATAAQHAAYEVLDERGEIQQRWFRFGGW